MSISLQTTKIINELNALAQTLPNDKKGEDRLKAAVSDHLDVLRSLPLLYSQEGEGDYILHRRALQVLRELAPSALTFPQIEGVSDAALAEGFFRPVGTSPLSIVRAPSPTPSENAPS